MNVTILLKSKLNFYWPTEKLAIEGKNQFLKRKTIWLCHMKKNKIN